VLPRAIEVKAKKIIQRIEEGQFTENDIELLLIRLREFSGPKSIFREISHFIAHQKRDSGLTFTSLYKVYCRMRAYGEFQYHKKQLDLTAPIDKWFYDFVLFQLDEIESHVLKKKYGFSRKQAKKEFKGFFTENKAIYTCITKPTQNLINIVNEASSFIKMTPLFSCGDIVSSFSDTFKDLGLLQDSCNFEAQSERLILCLLVLMHKREFHIGKDIFGKTELDFPAEGTGKIKALELRGTIEIPNLTGIVVTLIETSIEFRNTCESDLLIEKETNIKGHYWTAFDLNSDFTITDNGKLCRL